MRVAAQLLPLPTALLLIAAPITAGSAATGAASQSAGNPASAHHVSGAGMDAQFGTRAQSPAGHLTPSAERPAIGAGALRVEITEMTPSVAEAEGKLSLRGTIRNVGEVSASDVTVTLRLSSSPLPNRSEIPQVLVTGSSTRYGNLISAISADVTDQLAGGQSASFTLPIEVDDLGLGPPGAYVLGVEVRASTGAGPVAQDLDRTLLPWWPADTDAEPLLVCTLWPISGRPQRDASGILLSEDLAVDMSPSGRLDNVIAAAQANPAAAATLLIDPEVVEAAAAMSTGYTVVNPDGEQVPGTRVDEVDRWLDRMADLVGREGSQVSLSLYGNPDVTAARRGKVLDPILAQRPMFRDSASQILGLDAASELAQVPGGMIDQATVDDLAAADLAGLVLSDQAMAPAPPVSFTPSGNVHVPAEGGHIPALLVDSAIADTLAMPARTPAEVTRARQRLLAETIVTVGELPGSQRLIVASPQPWWDVNQPAAETLLAALADPPWVTPVSMSDALQREPSSVERGSLKFGDAQIGAELSKGHVADVRGHFEGLAQYRRVVSDASDLAHVTVSAPNREMSGFFRAQQHAAGELLGRVTEQVESALSSIRVISTGTVTVSGASGTIPVTVENTGPVAVTVGLQLTSNPAQLFLADPVPAVRIDPDKRTSLEVTAQVAAGGPIPVDIAIVDVNGEPFGEPTVLVVESAAYAGAARVLVRASLLFLVLAVLIHTVRRSRRSRAAEAAASQDQTSDTGSGSGSGAGHDG